MSMRYATFHFTAFLDLSLHFLQSTVFKSNKKIEDIKAKMKWDQQVIAYL